MNEAEMKRWVRKEIQSQLNIIMSASSGLGETVEDETISSLFPGSPDIPNRPVMHPYGFASRATSGTINVVGKHGSDPSNRMVLGHRDSNRPDDLEEGESTVYSMSGYEIRASKDGIRVIKGSKKFALLLGEDIITFLAALVDVLALHTHGPPGTPPTNAADITKLKTDNLAGSTLLSTEDGGFG